MVKHKRAFSVRIVFLRIRLEEHTVPTSLARSANLLYQQQLVAISDKKKSYTPTITFWILTMYQVASYFSLRTGAEASGNCPIVFKLRKDNTWL